MSKFFMDSSKVCRDKNTHATRSFSKHGACNLQCSAIRLSPTDENGNVLEVQIEMETDPHYDLLSLSLRLQEISKAFALVCFSCRSFFPFSSCASLLAMTLSHQVMFVCSIVP